MVSSKSNRPTLRILSLLVGLSAAACEGDGLTRAQEPDGGVPFKEPDAAPPPEPEPPEMDASVPGRPDAGRPDAGALPVANERVYAHTRDTLYAFDPATGTIRQIGKFGLPGNGNMTDIAIDGQGRLFGGDEMGNLYRIDPTTAASTFLFRLGLTPTGLTFLGDGRLVVAGTAVTLVDVDTGAISGQFVAPGGLTTSGDIVALPDGQLYATVVSFQAPNDILVRIDPAASTVVNVGRLSFNGVFGVSYASGVLYGFTSAGMVIQVDPATGSLQGSIMFDLAFQGATTNPVMW